MKKNISILLFTFLVISSVFGQTFEGKIIYENSFKSKMTSVKDSQFVMMIGNRQEYFIKDGDYKTTFNGKLFESQCYTSKENKLYTKMTNSEAFLWNDGNVNPDEVLKVKINKNVLKVLDYMCDEVILTCKSGVQKYYFNAVLSVDSQLFINHKYGNWYDFISKSRALPLKSIIENAQFILESTATSITKLKLENSFFQLPANAKTKKSPY
jgi:hypothetical protein